MNSLKPNIDRMLAYIQNSYSESEHAYRSTPGGPVTLYATCFALMTKHYLHVLDVGHDSVSLEFILQTQDPATGFFVGPEMASWSPPQTATHDREHILLHTACTVLPVLELFGVNPKYPLKFAEAFCDLEYLNAWIARRDWKAAWLEGNNYLFVGQLLVYLRDRQANPPASAALARWFEWLDQEMAPDTGFWGSNGFCSPAAALYGGYHQMLVYYHESHPVPYFERMIDTALSLQALDGGFSAHAGGGACEDVDSIDVLVNCYKLSNHRRAEIRFALRRALRQIVSQQLPDGGFPYRPNAPMSHLGIPATHSPANQSNMFPTWFRVHTLALMAEILTDEATLQEIDWQFNPTLSMGWHRKWDKSIHLLDDRDRKAEEPFAKRFGRTRGIKIAFKKAKKLFSKARSFIRKRIL